jgi:PAS domain S-box-containing protein
MTPLPEELSGTGRLIAAVFSNSSDAVVVVDETGSIVLASPAITSLFGYYPEELVGESIDLLVPEEHRDLHSTHRKSFLTTGHARRMGSGLQLFGLTRDGDRLPIDVSLNPTTVGGRRYVAAFVRDATDRMRSMRQVAAANEVTSLLLSGASLDETLHLILANARDLVGGVAAWSVIPKSDEILRIEAVDGIGTEDLLGLEFSATKSGSGRVIVSGDINELDEFWNASNVPEPIQDLDLGPAIHVPLAHEGRTVGALVIARRRGEDRFDPFEINLISLFANAASVALVLGDNRQKLDRLLLLEEDERIARDLHDSVIQRAFSIALSLQAIRSFSAEQVRERIDSAVEGLDLLIRELRSSIFELSNASPEDSDQREEP